MGFADLTRFLKRACPFVVKTTEIALNTLNVDLEVILDEISVFLNGVRISRNEGSWGWETGLCRGTPSQKDEEDYSLNATKSMHSGAPKRP